MVLSGIALPMFEGIVDVVVGTAPFSFPRTSELRGSSARLFSSRVGNRKLSKDLLVKKMYLVQNVSTCRALLLYTLLHSITGGG